MSKIHPEEIRQKAVMLRRRGLTYREIQQLLGKPVPKNTFTGWFKNIELSEKAQRRIVAKVRESGSVGRAVAWENIRKKRENLLKTIYSRVDLELSHFLLDNLMTSKVYLALLYLAEGGKTGETIKFGNSDPKIIKLFMKLFRQVFPVDERKLRCQIQCRADQDTQKLGEFWSKVTEVPLSQFYKAKIDERTLGKPTKRLDYKGVLVVYYFSNAIFLELKFVADIIYKRLDINLGP